MKLLNELAKHHNEWVHIVKTFGEHNTCEDIVQEMYIKLNKYTKLDNITNNGKLNKSYVWLTLRNLYYNQQKQSNKVNYIDIEDCKGLEALNTSNEELSAQSRLNDKVNGEIESWHWADKLLFEIYLNEGKSMRKLAEDTGISVTTIFWTIKKCKQRLRENVGEDYDDYYNRDFELI